jgi:hypothetical protein
MSREVRKLFCCLRDGVNLWVLLSPVVQKIRCDFLENADEA